MAEGRSRAMWGHTASVLTLLANVNRDPKKTRPYKVEDFMPRIGPSKPLPKLKMKDLRSTLMGTAAPKRERPDGR